MTITVNEKTYVSLKEAEDLIIHNPNKRFALFSGPGIGKTSLAGTIEKRTDMKAYIIPCTDIELGDVAMPVIDHEGKVTKFYPSERFGLQFGKPVVIVLDEFFKASQPVQNMLHPLLEQFRPRLAGAELPEGSLVFLTGNELGGVLGDNMKGHTRNRIIELNVRGAINKEWRVWLAENGGHPVMQAVAEQNPQLFATYEDDPENQHIWNPDRPNDSYFSLRSGKTVSDLYWTRDLVTPNAFRAAVEGAVGKATADLILQFDRFQEQMPAWDDIIENPMTTPIPTDPGALAMFTFMAVERFKDSKELESVLNYLERTNEWDAIFCVTTARHKTKNVIAFKNQRFALWVADNEDLL